MLPEDYRRHEDRPQSRSQPLHTPPASASNFGVGSGSNPIYPQPYHSSLYTTAGHPSSSSPSSSRAYAYALQHQQQQQQQAVPNAYAYPYTPNTHTHPSYASSSFNPHPYTASSHHYGAPDSSFRGGFVPHNPASPSTHLSNEQLSALIDAKFVQLGQQGTQGVIENMDFTGANRTYRITPIQHPERSSAMGEIPTLSRIPLSPPLIVQLDCWASDGSLEIPYDELPFLVCHLSLETPDGQDAMMVDTSTEGVIQNLYGTMVAAPAQMRNQDGANGVYFCFPDVSVRMEGSFRLRCSLFRITGGGPLAVEYSNTFDVVDNDGYVAPAITPMTQHFHNQGVVRFGLPQDEW